jgi:3-mercaptopyruvate sulfurtransferase SseA
MGSRGLVSASWLLGNLGRAGVKVVDASYSMPANDHFELFQRERIPGAGVAGAP